MKRQPQKTKNYSASEFFRICDDAITWRNTTKEKKLSTRHEDIGVHYRILLNKRSWDIVVVAIIVTIVILLLNYSMQGEVCSVGHHK